MGLILDKPNKTHLYSVRSTTCSLRAMSHLFSLSAFTLGVLEVGKTQTKEKERIQTDVNTQRTI